MSGMTPWETIEEALRRKRPPRGPQWLADQLGTTIQVLGNWKKRRVPPGKYRAIANEIGLTVDQIEGISPLPWDAQTSWPFPDIDLLKRVELLDRDQRIEIQAKVRELVDRFEATRLNSANYRNAA